jgi:hypothetical protein
MSYSNGGGASSYSTSYGTPGGVVGGNTGPAAPYGVYAGIADNSNSDAAGLRRRTGGGGGSYSNGYSDYANDSNGKGKKNRAVVERLDFMFPKVDREFTVQTQGGGIATIVAYGLIAILVLAETVSWYGQNRMELSTTVVDTSLGKKMRVNMNITFPGLACDDLHLDAIDVAGDSQINIEDTLVKRKLHADGRLFSKQEIEVDTNFHREQQAKKERLLKEELPADYCGPCYGAHETDGQCCQTCDVSYIRVDVLCEMNLFGSKLLK